MVKLYSLDKKDKIRVFQIEVELSGPTSPNTAYIHTATGLIDGQLIFKKTTITKGKQKRTVNQQAEFEASAEIISKKDEGYKSLVDLEIRANDLGIKDILQGDYLVDSELNKVKKLFNLLNIKFNTNQYWLPLPMLAEKWKEHKKKTTYPVYVQPKLNGVRCIALWSDKHNKVLLLSRGGQVYQMPHIEEILTRHLQYKPDIILDGELYKHGMRLQQISGIVRLEDKTQFDRKLPIQYHIYDYAVPNMKQSHRLSAVDAFVSTFNNPNIVSVPSAIATKEENIKTLHDSYVAYGYEGAIVREYDGLYQFGFRDSCLLKVKEFIDEEFEILGCDIDPNEGIDSFVFILKNNTNDLTFKARPTGTREEKDIWRQNISNFIGKQATVRFQERTADDLPHQGHVRHEKTGLLVEAIRDYE